MRPRLEEEEDSDRLRCFVAALLDPAVLEELQVVQRLLRRQLETGVRWTQPEQMHLTLHFLGEVEAADLGELASALDRAASDRGVVDLHLERLGAFPERGRPRVLWAGLGGDLESLNQLQLAVVEAVAAFGDHQDLKAFHPHLTLGRVRTDFEIHNDLSKLLGGVAGPRPLRWSIRELALMSSDLLPSGARYNVIHTVALG